MNKLQYEKYDNSIAQLKLKAESLGMKIGGSRLIENDNHLKVIAHIEGKDFYVFRIGPRGGMQYLTENNTWRKCQKMDEVLVR